MKQTAPQIDNKTVAEVFAQYPIPVREKLLYLRQLILETAAHTEGVSAVEETLKWGEPSYVARSGSTVRIDWKKVNPQKYAMYFHCQTKLIDTFRELYSDKFEFDGNRAILFGIDDDVPIEALKHCIALSLTYHRRKHLPLLGA